MNRLRSRLSSPAPLFALVAVVLVAAAACGAGLWEDGSYTLYHVLQTGRPAVFHGRLINALLQQPVLWVSSMTYEFRALCLSHGLPYTLFPLLALVGCWANLRGEHRALFIWPVMAICLMKLPGQFFFASEANACIDLFWIVYCVFLADVLRATVEAPWKELGRHLTSRLVALVGIAAILFVHPVGVVLLFVLCGSAALACRRRGQVDWRLVGWALVSVVAGVVATLRWTHQLARTPILLGPARILEEFRNGVVGLPLIALVAFLIAGALLVRPPAGPRGAMTSRRARRAAVFLGLGGIVMLAWALLPTQWKLSTDFRRFGVLANVPFLGWALIEALRERATSEGGLETRWRHRVKLIHVCGIVFAAVLAIQSAHWVRTTQRLRAAMAASPEVFIPIESLDWFRSAPARAWTIPSYSLLLQGRTPAKVLLEERFVQEAKSGTGIRLAPWDLQRWNPAGFDFSRLRAAADESSTEP